MRSTDGLLSRPELFRLLSAGDAPGIGAHNSHPQSDNPQKSLRLVSVIHHAAVDPTPIADANESFSESLGEFRQEFIPSADSRNRQEKARHIWNMVYYRGIQYSSRSMAVCGALLEAHIPGFKIKYGENLEVPVGQRQHVDFLINSTFVEYHPIVIKNELGNSNHYRRWVQRLKSLSARHQNDFAEGKKDELLEDYYNRRRAAIDRDPLHRGKELIAVRTPHAFWKEVLIRFGKGVPSHIDGFMSQFSTLMDLVTEENAAQRDLLRAQLKQGSE